MPSSWTEDHAIELDGQMLPQELDQMMSLDQRMPLDQMMPLDQNLHQNLHQNQNLQLARGVARELALLTEFVVANAECVWLHRLGPTRFARQDLPLEQLAWFCVYA